MITIKTKYPVATDSPDHIFPWGTMRDNNTNSGYIKEVEEYFGLGNRLNILDLGCAGGQLIKDFHYNGHLAIGLEGSDYSLKNNRACWPELYNKALFTCDISKPFWILDYEIKDKEQQEGIEIPIKFDLISAWEVIEHIAPEDLDQMFDNIYNHLKDNGIFVGTISLVEDVIQGHRLHQSVFPSEWWMEKLNKKFIVEPYCFKNLVRADGTSLRITLKKK